MLHVKDFVAVAHPLTELDLKAMPESTELGKGHIDYRTFSPLLPPPASSTSSLSRSRPSQTYRAGSSQS